MLQIRPRLLEPDTEHGGRIDRIFLHGIVSGLLNNLFPFLLLFPLLFVDANHFGLLRTLGDLKRLRHGLVLRVLSTRARTHLNRLETLIYIFRERKCRERSERSGGKSQLRATEITVERERECG